ncbi:RDD family protein [Streptomyces sp. NPDC046977]|uniref:RDD family protein n=1 Tax=Streptomyces sp. NPDC046977 TaxID=3154703 RepID=UPI0033EA558F
MSTDRPEDPFAKPPQEPQQPSPPPPSGTPPASGGPYDQPPPVYPGGPYGGAPQGGPYDTPYGGAPTPDPLAGMPPLAHRGRRLLARIVDGLIIGIPIYAITWAFWGAYDYTSGYGKSFAEGVIYAVVYLVYQVLMLTRYGQSLGKKLLKVRVGMLADGTNPSTPAALKREAVYSLVPVIPCCGSIFWIIEVLWCTWDKPYRQCLHDKAGQTVVVSAA